MEYKHSFHGLATPRTPHNRSCVDVINMGNLLTSALDALVTLWTRSCKIVIVGLDGAGKTTLLYKLVRNETVETSPTIGANYEEFRHKNIEFMAMDFGGDSRTRPMWRVYLQETDALIFVVDASDHDRIDEAATELKHVFTNEALDDAKLLIYANKQDVAGCMSVEELHKKLNLAEIPNPSHIQMAAAVTGEGLAEGIQWIHEALTDQ